MNGPDNQTLYTASQWQVSLNIASMSHHPAKISTGMDKKNSQRLSGNHNLYYYV